MCKHYSVFSWVITPCECHSNDHFYVITSESFVHSEGFQIVTTS